MISLPLPRLRRGGIPVEDGKRFVRFIRYWRPLEIASDDAAGYRHPYQVLARWDGIEQRWEVQHFRDSMVGGRDVEAPPLAWDSLPRETRRRLGDRDPGGLSVPWLSEEPWIPLPDFRAIGTDASPFAAAEEVPEFLLERGVGEADRADVTGTTLAIQQSGTPEERAQRRLGRVADIVLNVERERVRITAGDDGRIAITLDGARRKLPWITIQADRFDPVLEAGSVQEQIAAALGDTGIDRLLVARVYLISVPGAAPGSPVDETWTAIVKQELFWNVEHDTTRDLRVFEDLELPRLPALAGGVAQAQIDALTEGIEQADAAASAFLSAAQVRGMFWTV